MSPVVVHFPLATIFLCSLLSCFSYGPCQTPTLGFCVQRYLQITSFKPEKFWTLHPYLVQNGYELKLEWERQKLFDFDVRLLYFIFAVLSHFMLSHTRYYILFCHVTGCYDVSEVGYAGWNLRSN